MIYCYVSVHIELCKLFTCNARTAVADIWHSANTIDAKKCAKRRQTQKPTSHNTTGFFRVYVCMQTLQVRAQLRGPKHCFVAPIQLPARFVPVSGEYVLTVKSVTVRTRSGRNVPMQLSSTASVICMFVDQQ
jgi:hypothetical protein